MSLLLTFKLDLMLLSLYKIDLFRTAGDITQDNTV